MRPFQKSLRLFSMLTAGLLLLSGALTVSASVPYISYVYDSDKLAVESPDVYRVTDIMDGVTLQVGAFNKPQDMTKDSQNRLYVVDTGNNRIVMLDADRKHATALSSFTYQGKTETLSSPQSVFVRGDQLYISDTGHFRVIVSDRSGNISRIYNKPDSDLFGENTQFKPKDLVVSSAGTLYVLVEGVYEGAVMFQPNGEFAGYFGSNKVKTTLSVLSDFFWKNLMTKEQRSRMRRYVPVQYSSLQIDSEDFVYLTTEAASSESERVRKLNPLGENILRSGNDNEVFYGDTGSFLMQGVTYSTALGSIDVIDGKYITVLDTNQMRIFQYSQECDLLIAFGCSGNMKGAFTAPVALCGFGDELYVLDAQKNNITGFALTAYGQTLHKAVDIYTDGRYQESLPYWQDILKYNSTSILANRGVGKALYQVGRSEEAMTYFEKCGEKTGYSSAFNEVRRRFVRSAFTYMVIGLVLLVIAIWLLIRYHVFSNLWKRCKNRRRV